MRALAAASVLVVLVSSSASSAAAEDRKTAEAKKKEADDLAAAGKKADALAAYEAAMDADAAYEPAYQGAVLIWFASKAFDKAEARLRAAVGRDASFAFGWYNLAFVERKLGHEKEAIEAYQKFSALKPNEPDPYYGMGMAYSALGDAPHAKDALTKYIAMERRDDKQKFVAQAKELLAKMSDAPTAPAPPLVETAASHRDKGIALEKAKKLDEAIVEYRAATRIDAKDDNSLYLLAHALRATGKHAEAIAAYRAYIALKPERPDPWYGLGQSLAATNDRAAARDALAKYIAMENRESEQKYVVKAREQLAGLKEPAAAPVPVANADRGPVTGDRGAGKPVPPPPPSPPPPPVPVATRDRGPVTGDRGAGEPADRGAGKPGKPVPPPPPSPSPAPPPVADAIPSVHPTSSAPDPATVYLSRGDSAFSAKKYSDAATAYRKAITLDPSSAEARYRLGVALAAANDLAHAIEAWEGVLLLDPAHERARRNIELARRRTDKKDAELDDAAIVVARARALLADGREATARLLLDRLLERSRDPDAYALRGEARLAAGDADGAVADFATALGGAPRRARIYRGLGDAYTALHDAARARYYYELYLARIAADPDPDEQPHVTAVKRLLAATASSAR